MKIVLFVEGRTERQALPSFLKRWMDARTRVRVGLKVVSFNGSAHYDTEIAKRFALNVAGRADVLGGIGLLDLFGLGLCPAHLTSAGARLRWAKRHFESKVGHERFVQHFAVHETEAWLLSAPEIHPSGVATALNPVREPERVNLQEPPAKLLDRLYREKTGQNYRKIIDGAALFRKLDPDHARARCPSLDSLLSTLYRFCARAD